MKLGNEEDGQATEAHLRLDRAHIISINLTRRRENVGGMAHLDRTVQPSLQLIGHNLIRQYPLRRGSRVPSQFRR